MLGVPLVRTLGLSGEDLGQPDVLIKTGGHSHVPVRIGGHTGVLVRTKVTPMSWCAGRDWGGLVV